MTLSRRRMLLGSLALGLTAWPLPAFGAKRRRKPRKGAHKPRRAARANTEADRKRAIVRGLRYVYATARVPRHFAEYGEDYLWCFHTISATAADPELARLARRMGEERAQVWRRMHPGVPANLDADMVASLAFGAHTAGLLGAGNDTMREELQRAAARFGPADFLQFDPASEPPPQDVPDTCVRCDNDNERGLRVCATCSNGLEMKSPYDVLCDALIATYTGDRYGVRLGAGYPQVAALIPAMRPYRGYEDGNNAAFIDIAYAVTHIVYTLNDYGAYRLKPEWLPAEFEFLKANVAASVALDDPETMGEFVDSLKAFGMTHKDAAIRTGIDYLIETQNRDGSWGDTKDKDIYQRYHPTWTAVDGLRDYAYRGEGVSFPEALERARG